jgi:uncharacterized protein (DUF433 family)
METIFEYPVVLDKHILVNTKVRNGKPSIAGTRITVADIVMMHLRLGQSLEEIAGKYDLSFSAVYAAMAFYHDHREEIDASIEADRAFVSAFQQNNPSLLREKLNTLKRG